MPGDLLAGLRLLGRLPAHLRRSLDPGQARRLLAERLARREAVFLDVVRRLVYGRPGRPNPSLALLRRAGCEYGDLERSVRHHGIEGSLSRLHREGVYVTLEEFKGREPLVRGSLSLETAPGHFRNPTANLHVPAGTAGSRGPATPVPLDLAFLQDRAVNTLLGLEARAGLGWVKAHWQVPGGGALARLIEFASFGQPPVAWFSQVDPAAPDLHRRYRWSARVLRWGGWLAGRPLPRPRYVPPSAPRLVLDWIRAVQGAGRTPHVFTFVSSAVRACQAAVEQGLDLEGAQFTVTGEPLTPARLAAIRRAGADAVSRYAIMECGAVGMGCLEPRAVDDVHVLHDLHAIIQTDTRAGRAALWVSSLRPTAPFVLLNVSMGDHATMEERRCGCPMESLGWTTHLRGIRSREKLTAGGMTFLDVDVARVLDEVLPARFGGAPTDYQLVEEESPLGRPSLRLLVSPSVGPVEAASVASAFLDALGRGDGVDRVMGLMWRDGGFLGVERRPPQTTPAGKILHVHVSSRKRRSTPAVL